MTKIGMVTHPNYTGSGKYNAGTTNSNTRNFNTKEEAVRYLKTLKPDVAYYSTGSGTSQNLNLKAKKRVVKRKPAQPKFGFLGI